MGVTALATCLAAFIAICVAAAASLPAGQLPPVPGYIPVYIQSGDSPPDLQRVYEAHRPTGSARPRPTSAAANPVQVPAEEPRVPQGSQPLRSRPATPNRITKKGAAGPAPEAIAAPAAAAVAPAPSATLKSQHKATSSAAKKRTGTRVQYQQQQKAAQTRKRQQQQRSAKQQQQQQQQQPQQHHYVQR